MNYDKRIIYGYRSGFQLKEIGVQYKLKQFVHWNWFHGSNVYVNEGTKRDTEMKWW